MKNLTSNNKTRIQVSVDSDLKNEAEEVLNNLGMTSTAAITMLFKRIVATDSYPVNLQMTEKERTSLELSKSLQSIPVKKLKNKKEIADFFEDDDADK